MTCSEPSHDDILNLKVTDGRESWRAGRSARCSETFQAIAQTHKNDIDIFN